MGQPYRKQPEVAAVAVDDGSDHHAHAGIFSTSANILCTMIGGGILSLPLAFAQASVIPALIICIIGAFLATASVFFMCKSCDATGIYSFRGLIVKSFSSFSPKLMGNLAEGLILLCNITVLMIYTRVIMDSMPDLCLGLFGQGVWTKDYFWVLVCGCFFALLSPIRRLNELLIVSVLGFVAIVFVSLVMYIRAGGPLGHGGNAYAPSEKIVESFHLSSGLLPSFSVVCAAYVFHMNVPPLYRELKDRSTSRMMLATVISVLIGAALYISVGLCGIYTFGKAEALNPAHGGNFLRHFTEKDIVANIGRVFIVLHMICAFPIYAIVARRSWHIIMTGTENEDCLWKRTAMGVTLVALGVGLSMVIPNLGVLVSLTGAIFGTSITFILPCVFYYRIYSRKLFADDAKTGKPTALLYGSIVIAILGVLQMVASLTVTIQNEFIHKS
ncbi:amino acid permease-like protein [Perkinsela sp. CCAP 1560/4]|nr:amino acid permease-like protein [Perkinsela sp. CCAP 1560/4]|eukprot:KNH08674.1 amino acid permease-like protein [Perkinsela sp. CCAP 1560/4]